MFRDKILQNLSLRSWVT